MKIIHHKIEYTLKKDVLDPHKHYVLSVLHSRILLTILISVPLLVLNLFVLNFHNSNHGPVPAIANAQSTLSVTEFALPPPFSGSSSFPWNITTGPDGNLWFTELAGKKIGRITPDGLISEFLTSNNSSTFDITSGPDGNIWFTESNGRIGRITPAGIISEFLIPTYNSAPRGIIVGPDESLWFAETGGDKIGRITTTGTITEFPIPTSSIYGAQPSDIALGADGNLWFTEIGDNNIGKITTSGIITLFPIPTDNSYSGGITAGPDGNIWFTENNSRKVGRITPSGAITEFPIPAGQGASQITSGPDGNLWFTAGSLGKITPTGEITFPLLNSISGVPYGITTGPDGNLWITEYEINKIARINLLSITPTPTLPPGSLNVPLLKQGIFPFNDNDPVREGNEYDHGNSQSLWCGTTIASCGCAATSIAMVLRYYNIVNPVDGAVTTPSTVNDYFNQNTQCGRNSCVSLGYAFGDVRWPAVNNYASEAHRNYGTQKIIYDGGGGYDASVVAQDITDSKPVILGVPNHWVVATGISDNTFTINDPLYTRTLLSDPAYNNTASQGMRRYKETNSDFSSIEVAVLAPAQVIITDPDGNKTGFDSNLSTIVTNIPNSSYFFDEALADDTGQRYAPPPNVGVHWVIVKAPQAGQYQIEVIESSNQSYSFAVYGSDRDANVSFKLFEGQLSSAPVKYSFDYSPLPNETTISQHVSIDVKPDGDSDVINPKSNGVVRAAILSTDTFDPMTADPLSVRLGPSNASANKNNQTKDINGDNMLDRVFYFSTEQTGINNGDTTVCLTGKTTDGFNIKGCGNIKTVP